MTYNADCVNCTIVNYNEKLQLSQAHNAECRYAENHYGKWCGALHRHFLCLFLAQN
jgi:hypothetical protein